MNTILEITYLYLLVLLLATLVERMMEVLMSVYHYLEWQFGWEKYWTRRAEQLAGLLARHLRRSWLENILDRRTVTAPYRKFLLDHKAGHSDHVLILSADLVRQIVVATAARFVATGLGILFCAVTRIDLVAIFNRDLNQPFLEHIPYFLRLIISGAIIGLGAEPVHRLIQTVERRRKKRARRIQQERLQAQNAGGGGK